jgi:short subunit dehydrogenase-like uncharacterized protein
MQRMARFSGVLRWGWVQAFLRRRIEARPPGPDERLRARSGVEVWGEARGADGRWISGTLSGPNGYDVTVSASLGITEHLLATDVAGGYTTPSLLMGPDFVTGLPGVEVVLGDVLNG